MATCVTSTLLLVMIDMVLDPGVVLLGLWHYDAGGTYYGVAWSNFFGWLISGVLCSTIFVYFSKEKAGEQNNLHFPMNLGLAHFIFYPSGLVLQYGAEWFSLLLLDDF